MGKSTLCRILCNYAVRKGRSPIFVDLDVGQNCLTVPGSISAAIVDQLADPVHGFQLEQQISYCVSIFSNLNDFCLVYLLRVSDYLIKLKNIEF